MYRQRIQKAWGRTAHRGWARLLLNRARDLITHGPAHRGTNGTAMPTDEGDQDGHFLTTPLPRRAATVAVVWLLKLMTGLGRAAPRGCRSNPGGHQAPCESPAAS